MRDRLASLVTTTAAERGHDVTLFDAAGSHRRPASTRLPFPGKGRDFNETLRYFRRRIETNGVLPSSISAVDATRCGTASTTSCWRPASCRKPCRFGHRYAKVTTYIEIIEGQKSAGKSFAVIGAGGIGRRREFLTHRA